MIKKIAWDTFKNTGDINTFLEYKEIEKLEKGIQNIDNVAQETQEIIDLIAYDKCLEEYNQEANYEIKDLIKNLKSDKNKKIAILLMSGYSLTE